MGLRQNRRPRNEVLKEFDQIWYQYSGKITHFALRVLGDPDEADDLVQKTFVALYTTLLLESISNPKIWLLRTAENNLRHYKRTIARRKNHEVPLEDITAEGIELEAPPPATSREDFIDNLPSGLKDKAKEILALYYYDRLDLREIATRTGYTYGGLRVHLSKLLSTLRQNKAESFSTW